MSGTGGSSSGNGGSSSGTGGSSSGNGGSSSGNGGSSSGNGGSTSGNGGEAGEAGQGTAGSGGLAGSPDASLMPMGPPTYWSDADAGPGCRVFSFVGATNPNAFGIVPCVVASYTQGYVCSGSTLLQRCDSYGAAAPSAFQLLLDASGSGALYDGSDFQAVATVAPRPMGGGYLIVWTNGDQVVCNPYFAMEAGQVCFTPAP
jgi:hypothetical protein